eukprot:CAMPEP_0204522418 /NCGR_PEP_ID=MMETSP0661-20131031/6312_1 /ASSEMBLY_ACC=CAM_ASM_000606 /TAXON_ID=109239 /ORGANISM="Alexandrium margalefi, Strain AMGDE01CS-322" /LENGTH=194 /DNA_ID=CAMNT_0051528083 /DNA_START=103 /DNA_END=684 /DNA_ORIENTATION=+
MAERRPSAGQLGPPSSAEFLGTDAVCKVRGGQPFILSVPRYSSPGEPAADRAEVLLMPLHEGVRDESTSGDPGPAAPVEGAPAEERQGSYKPGEMLVKSALLAGPQQWHKGPAHGETGPAAALPVLLGRTRQSSQLYQSLAEGTPTKPGSEESSKFWQASWTVQLPNVPSSLPGFPSAGSRGHHLGQCKPCAFV